MRFVLDQTTGGYTVILFKPLTIFYETHGQLRLEGKQIHRLFKYPNTNPQLMELQCIQRREEECDVGSTVTTN